MIEERSLYIVLKLPSVYPDLQERQHLFFQTSYERLARDQKKSHSLVNKSSTTKHGSLKRSTSAEPAHSFDYAPEPASIEGITIEDYLDLVRSEDDQDYKLLERMYPFFTGQFNHHDIMMISNCSRTKIDRLV